MEPAVGLEQFPVVGIHLEAAGPFLGCETALNLGRSMEFQGARRGVDFNQRLNQENERESRRHLFLSCLLELTWMRGSESAGAHSRGLRRGAG